MSQGSHFELLRSRRFLPHFLAQLLGAFNDNVFKQAVVLAILYKLTFSTDRDLLINLAAILFILPFFLFSTLGGQFVEKFAKDRLIRLIKLGEALIREGCPRILESHPVPVIPMTPRGLWGSFFSRAPNKGFFRRFWSKVALVAAEPLPPQEASTEMLQARVTALRGEAR